MPKQFSRILPASSGAGTREDRNNCFPRSIANTSGKDYTWVANRVKGFGRQDNQGSTGDTIYWTMQSLPEFKFVGCYGTTKSAMYWSHKMKSNRNKGITLEKFIQQNPKGRFMVLIRGHATTVIDGAVVDSFSQVGGASVVAVWKYEG